MSFILMLSLALAAYAQTPETPQVTPDFRVQVWGDVLVDFNAKVVAYRELRARLQKGLPELTVTTDPFAIRNIQRALAERIRAARSQTRQGDIFTPAITDQFKKALLGEWNAETCEAIMDDNPGNFSSRINRYYPATRPLSTMPPNILAVLPELPDDIQYRFLGGNLVLMDTQASLILDRIPFAIPCGRR